MDNAKQIFKGENAYDLHIMWSIHNKCNYQCSYCPDELHDGEFQWLKLDIMKGFINRIEEHYRDRLGFKNILFSFTGGEPTLWKDFKPFVQYIHEKGFRCGLTTNGSVSPNFWKGISQAFDYICLSFHPEKADSEKFVRCFEYLHDAENTVIPSVRVMMHPDEELWKKSENLVSEIKKFPNWSYECVHILKNYGMGSEKIEYGSEEKKQFLDNNAFQDQFTDNSKITVPENTFNYLIEDNDGKVEKLFENKLINDNNVNFKDWNCFIGIEQLFIHFSGDIKTSGCGAGRSIGNILYYDKIRFPTKPTKCNVSGCYCPTDIRITKSKPELDLKYNIPDDTGEMIQVGDENSPFDYRLVISITNETIAEYTLNGLVRGVNDYIDHILKSKNISRDKVLIYIIPDVHVRLEENPSLYEELAKINCFRYLMTPVFEKLRKEHLEDIAKGYDIVYCSVNKTDELIITNELIKVIQNYDNINLFVDVVENKSIPDFGLKVFQFVKIAMNNYKYFNYYLLNFSEDSLPYKLIESHGSHSISKSMDFDNIAKRFNRKTTFSIDEVVKFSTNRKSTISSEDLVNNKAIFTNWKCYLGSNFSFINIDGTIQTSFCAQHNVIGKIGENIHEVKLDSFDICKQAFCENIHDKLIFKTKAVD